LNRLLVHAAAALGTLLAVVSLTPVAGWWAAGLARPWDERSGDVLIVLAGEVLDNNMIGQTSYWRSMYALMTWKQGGFRTLVVSGEDRAVGPMLDFLVCEGIPRTAIVADRQSSSTHENAVNTALLLRSLPGRYVLLTSDYHMFRAWRAFNAVGVQTIGRPFPDALKRVNSMRARWGIFCDLTAESAAIAWYKWKGWI